MCSEYIFVCAHILIQDPLRSLFLLLQVVSNIQKLYALGQKLGKMPQLEQKKTLDNLPDKVPDLLLQQGIQTLG